MLILNCILFLPIVILMAIIHFIVLGISNLFKLERIQRQAWLSLVAIDRYANTLLGGQASETISSRLGRNKTKGCRFCSLVCRILSVFEEDHCEKSIGK